MPSSNGKKSKPASQGAQLLKDTVAQFNKIQKLSPGELLQLLVNVQSLIQTFQDMSTQVVLYMAKKLPRESFSKDQVGQAEFQIEVAKLVGRKKLDDLGNGILGILYDFARGGKADMFDRKMDPYVVFGWHTGQLGYEFMKEGKSQRHGYSAKSLEGNAKGQALYIQETLDKIKESLPDIFAPISPV